MSSQKEEVKHALMKGCGITSLYAINKWGITRLSAIIFILKKEGMDIQTDIIEGKTRYGHHYSCAEYKLRGEYNEN